jgi:hypothetical protein
LHALPGSQNHHWHSDNPTHVPAFWEHRHFQDRVVNLWEAIADHYRGNRWVAGYNLLNEPADESRSVVGPFYRRLVTAIRAVDPDHTVFLDGNTYATEFDIFDEPFENAGLYVARLCGCRPRAQPSLQPRGSGAEVPEAIRVRAIDRQPHPGGGIRTDLHRERAGGRAAPRHPRRPARPLPAAFGELGAVDVQGHRSAGSGLGSTGHAVSSPVRRLRGQEEPACRRPVGQRRNRCRRSDAASSRPDRAGISRLRPLPLGPIRLGPHATAQHHHRTATST